MPAGQRDRLERVCRYALRPPIAQDRLELTAEGQVQLQLRRPWSDGTAHLLLDPVELLERRAALTPRPRIDLILYYGVLAPRAAWRADVVRFGKPVEDPAVIERILRHLELPTDIPEARPARPPPMPFLLDGLATAGGDDQILVDTRS